MWAMTPKLRNVLRSTLLAAATAAPDKNNSPQRHKGHKERHREKHREKSPRVATRGLAAFPASSLGVFLCALCAFVVNPSSYHAKWAKALFESAILMVFSR